ncbi:DUF1636 family protein [Salinihabitans flavidus]|nr:DUF1636 domain-containing protein [Salinihabitans flavidus]
MSHVIHICESCARAGQPPEGREFAEALRRALEADDGLCGVEVRGAECMNICDDPVSLALRAPGKPAYLFSGIRPQEDLDDVLELLRLYCHAGPKGITDARPAGRLRFCLVGRVPA